MAQGPLQGVRIVEFAGLGPTSFCGMLLSDLGADVVRIDRIGGNQSGMELPPTRADIMARGRRSVALDLKDPKAVAACLALIEKADGLIEGFRPGVMERIGLGPDVALQHNPRLAYGRMTGWGQSGPLAQLAGHDLNYIAISGALHSIGPAERPIPPLSVVGDFGGGSLYLAFGLVSAIMSARSTGRGQVIDCAMTDGAASLMAATYSLKAAGSWRDERAANIVDGGAHFYDSYRCSDGKWVAVAAIEPKFYALLLEKTGLVDPGGRSQMDRSQWPRLRQELAAIFAQRTRREWCEVMADADACFAPVLDLDEAPHHPHNVHRNSYVVVDGVVQPAPAPRFSDTPGAIQGGPPELGAHNLEALRDWGLPGEMISELFTREPART